MFEEPPRDPSLADPLPTQPISLLARWFEEASQGRVTRNPHAMSIATVGLDGRPRSRVVLRQGFEPDPGYLVFYTNRDSDKGRELAKTPFAAATFHWDAMGRQVRIEGPIVLSPDEESDTYFDSRPRPAQIAAWGSAQSQPIASRDVMIRRFREREAYFGSEGAPVPRPPHWGGYRLHFERIEFWIGADTRAHDRACYTRRLGAGGAVVDGNWTVERLQP
jgi:pyridoxamine 5'-phosphate oxidase